MTPLETSQLLAAVATLDNRHFDNATVAAWARLLAEVDAQDASDAVVRHFQTSDDYLMPVHVLRGGQAIAAERAQAIAAETLPPIAVDRTDVNDQQPGALVVRYVLAGLAAARRRDALASANELALELTNDARKRYGLERVEPRLGTPCHRPHCVCTHTDGCEAGWIEVQPDPEPDPVLFGEQQPYLSSDVGRVRPCPICRPAVAEIIENGRNRRAVQATLRTRASAGARRGKAAH